MMILRVMICHYVFKVCRLVLNVNLGMCWYNSVAMLSQDDTILCRRKAQKSVICHCQPSLLRSQCAVQHFQHQYLNIWQHEAGHVGAPQTTS